MWAHKTLPMKKLSMFYSISTSNRSAVSLQYINIFQDIIIGASITLCLKIRNQKENEKEPRRIYDKRSKGPGICAKLPSGITPKIYKGVHLLIPE